VWTQCHPVFPWLWTSRMRAPAQGEPVVHADVMSHSVHTPWRRSAKSSPSWKDTLVALGCSDTSRPIRPVTATRTDHDAYAECPTRPLQGPQYNSIRRTGTGGSMPAAHRDKRPYTSPACGQCAQAPPPHTAGTPPRALRAAAHTSPSVDQVGLRFRTDDHGTASYGFCKRLFTSSQLDPACGSAW
jgi:hypothetical protein